MKVFPARPEIIRHVALHMRDRDVEEFSAVSDYDDRESLAAALEQRYAGREDVLAFGDDTGPVAVGGVLGLRPGSGGLLFFATDRFPAVALPLTRAFRRVYLPAAAAEGIHRIEAVSIATHEDAHRWLGVLGLRFEAAHPGYGKRGQTFFTYARVRL